MTAARENERRFLRAATGKEPAQSPALALYRRLVRGNVLGVMRGVLPRTAAALGPRLDSVVDDFLAGPGPRTPHVRDVPAELVSHAQATWDEATRDLARLELTEFRIGYEERCPPTVMGPLAMEAPLALARPLALETFEVAVQSTGLEPDPHALLFYRDADEHVRTLRLSAMARVLLREALSGATLQAALITAATETGITLDETTLTSTARFLDDLSERGVVLGAAAP